MFYTSLDKKLLAAMINTQADLQGWVVVDSLHQSLYHSNGYDSCDVKTALKSGCFNSVSLKPYEIELALDNLITLGFVVKPSNFHAYHVTYRGWYDRSIRYRTALYGLMQNIIIPIIVAVLSSIITTVIMNLILSGR